MVFVVRSVRCSARVSLSRCSPSAFHPVPRGSMPLRRMSVLRRAGQLIERSATRWPPNVGLGSCGSTAAATGAGGGLTSASGVEAGGAAAGRALGSTAGRAWGGEGASGSADGPAARGSAVSAAFRLPLSSSRIRAASSRPRSPWFRFRRRLRHRNIAWPSINVARARIAPPCPVLSCGRSPRGSTGAAHRIYGTARPAVSELAARSSIDTGVRRRENEQPAGPALSRCPSSSRHPHLAPAVGARRWPGVSKFRPRRPRERPPPAFVATIRRR